MNKQKVLWLPAAIFNLIVAVFGIICNIQFVIMPELPIFFKITAGLTVFALLFALQYLFLGYKKDVATSFRWFITCYAVSQIAAVVNISSMGSGTAYAVITGVTTVIFGLLVVMAVGKDLGKPLSFTICGIIFALQVAIMIVNFIYNPGIVLGGDKTGTIYTIFVITRVTLAAILGISTVAKYIDKANRNTQ